MYAQKLVVWVLLWAVYKCEYGYSMRMYVDMEIWMWICMYGLIIASVGNMGLGEAVMSNVYSIWIVDSGHFECACKYLTENYSFDVAVSYFCV